jgi:hypothetical protein
MTAYTYKCEEHGIFEKIMPIREHKRSVYCACGRMAFQVIQAPMLIIPKNMQFKSPIDGTPITSEKAWREDMARSNCIEYDPGMRQDVDRRVQESDRQLDRFVDETVDKEIAAMPTQRREKLETELNLGLTAETVRI